MVVLAIEREMTQVVKEGCFYFCSTFVPAPILQQFCDFLFQTYLLYSSFSRQQLACTGSEVCSCLHVSCLLCMYLQDILFCVVFWISRVWIRQVLLELQQYCCTSYILLPLSLESPCYTIHLNNELPHRFGNSKDLSNYLGRRI